MLSFGLLWSRFLISLGMIFMLIAGLYGGSITEKFQTFIKNKYYLGVTGIFFLFLLSGLWTDNHDYFIQRMTIKLPFFFLPFAVCSIRDLDKEDLIKALYVFVAFTLTGVLWSVGFFLTDISYYIEIYSKGQILPTPVHHIRFSIMVSIAIAMCFYLFIQGEYLFRKQEKNIFLFLAFLMTIYLHLLAVRSGLMTLYVLLIVSFIYLIKNHADKKTAFTILLSGMAIVVCSIFFVPTVKNKIGYMKYSLENYAEKKDIRELSDSRRLASIEAGIILGKENPILGVGYGDLKDETNNYLIEHYPELKDLDLLPHNQYILALSTAGIIGMLLFILFTTLPFFYHQAYSDFLFLSTQLMFLVSFIVEHTIEAQIGTALYIFVLLLVMKNVEVRKLTT